MKKNIYIQPTIEVAKMQQTQALCVSPVIGDELEGGSDPDHPLNI